jgi:nitrite reductase/ring-hydroxylating ferredoxin subunit
MSVPGDLGRRRRATPLEPIVEAVEAAAVLDAPAKAIAKAARGAIGTGPVKDALSGTWLGHALHPLLTDLVIGSLMSSTLLDVLGGDADGTASRRLIGVGIAAYPPTALAGVNDWADAEPGDDGVRRSGLTHAATNLAALGLYTASLAARRRGAHGRGKLLGAGGAALLMAGGYLGGHLSFAKGVGPDQTVFDPGPTEWTPAADASQLADGRPTRVVVDETPVLLLREGERYFAIHDRCSHRGCSLSEGSVEGDHIVCPCHGSTFDRRDGSVQRGPATAPQPAFQVRVTDGRVELRRLKPV